MEGIYIKELEIEHVRHLKNITIPICDKEKKHLILTGKNGSGKTSVLEAVAAFLEGTCVTNNFSHYKDELSRAMHNLSYFKEKKDTSENEVFQMQKNIEYWKNELNKVRRGIALRLNQPLDSIYASFTQSEFIVAYYKAERVFMAEAPRHVEKVALKEQYGISEEPRRDFIKYLLDLKMTEALAISGDKPEKAAEIQKWFTEFENLLKRIFENDSVKLVFDEETFSFAIQMSGRELFDFNTLSSGYAAVLDIVVDLMLRMERKTGRKFRFDFPGIVLIDEIETHLHLDLQKKILDLLTTVFPKVQFIVSTHSPFILNSRSDVVIYDLENHVLVKDGLSDVPYEGIVEGYFHVDAMSEQLREKFDRYKELVKKEKLTDEDFREIAELELYLDEIPDYLALDVTTEYAQRKLELEHREGKEW